MGMNRSFKKERKEKAIKETIFSYITQNIDDIDLKNITITRVKLSKDERSAKVFFATLLNQDKQDIIKEKLEEIRIDLQNILKRLSILRFTPKLYFEYDKEFISYMRIEDIFREIKKEERNGE